LVRLRIVGFYNFIVGFVFQVVFYGIFYQPGKRIKPLQQEKKFCNQIVPKRLAEE